MALSIDSGHSIPTLSETALDLSMNKQHRSIQSKPISLAEDVDQGEIISGPRDSINCYPTKLRMGNCGPQPSEVRQPEPHELYIDGYKVMNYTYPSPIPVEDYNQPIVLTELRNATVPASEPAGSEGSDCCTLTEATKKTVDYLDDSGNETFLTPGLQGKKELKKRGRKVKDKINGITVREMRRRKKTKIYELPPVEDADLEKKRQRAINAKLHRDLVKQRMLRYEEELKRVTAERDDMQREVRRLQELLGRSQLQIDQREKVHNAVNS